MKIEEVDIQAISSDDFKTLKFRVDQRMAQILFRDKLYSAGGKLRVIAQEYMANARDAHRVAGKSDTPIEVTVPTALSPEFIVRDYGEGISPKMMEDIFVVYGASTKKDSNELNGGYGIGAKCAFSYANAFSVTTIHQGMRYVYAASIDSKGENQLDLIDSGPTPANSGTEIRIPINASDAGVLRAWISDVTHYWHPRPVFSTITVAYGEEKPVHTGERYCVYAGKPPMFTATRTSAVCVTVDDIPYAISEAQLADLGDGAVKLAALLSKRQHSLVLHFKCGDISLPPHRESIDMTAKTKLNLGAAIRKFLSSAESYASAKLAAAVEVIDKAVIKFSKDIMLAVAFEFYPQNLLPAEDGAAECVAAGVRRFWWQIHKGRLLDEHVLCDVSLKLINEPHPSSKPAAGSLVIAGSSRRLSRAVIKEIAREYIEDNNRIYVTVIDDPKKFKAAIGVDYTDLSKLGAHVHMSAPPKIVSRTVAPKPSYVYVDTIVPFSQYAVAGLNVRREMRRVPTTPGWYNTRVWVKPAAERGLVRFKEGALTPSDLMCALYHATNAGKQLGGQPSSRAVGIWQARYSDYMSPGDSITWADDYFYSAIAHIKTLDKLTLAERYASVVGWQPAPDWAMVDGGTGESLLWALEQCQAPYTADTLKAFRAAARWESTKADQPAAAAAGAWEPFAKFAGQDIVAMYVNALSWLYAVRDELHKIATVTPMVANLASVDSYSAGFRVRENKVVRSVLWRDVIAAELAHVVDKLPFNKAFSKEPA